MNHSTESSVASSMDSNVFFFFQAEDGIRDDLVTGVQTCALPICGLSAAQGRHLRQAGSYRVIMPRNCLDLKSIRISRAGMVRALMVSGVVSVGGCAAGPDFARQIGRASCRERV